MLKVAYQLAIGSWSVDSSADPRTELIGLETRLDLANPGGSCRVVVYAPAAPKPGLLEQAVGAATEALGIGGGAGGGPPAFSIDVRGQKIKCADQITVKLTAGD